MLKLEYIVIHHSLTKDQEKVDWNAITRFHTSWRKGGDIISPDQAAAERAAGAKDIVPPWPYNGYNFGVEKVDGVWTLQTGHRVGLQGYHTKEAQMNFRSVGICMVGNFDEEPPPQDGLLFLRGLCYAVAVNHDISIEKVIGHREAGLMVGMDWRKGQYKSCPGAKFDMDAFRLALISKGDTP